MLDPSLYRVSPFQPNGSDEQAQTTPALKTYPLEEFVRLNLPRRELVLSPILSVSSLAMLVAYRGVGKTQVALGLTYAVSCGSKFLRWHAPKPRRTLFVDGEMPGALLQERARAMMAGSPEQPPDGYFNILPMDVQALGTTLNLALPDHQAAIEARLGGAELLSLDNVSTLVNAGRENEAESWNEMQAWLLRLRRQGVAVLLVHHAGRSGNPRGTSKREDVLDTVIQLKHPEDYDPEQGARFEVHLTKARGVHGEDALPFEAQLKVVEGRDHWTCSTLRNRELDEVERLTRAGKTVRDIAAELGCGKTRVNDLQGKLRAEGRL